MAQENVVNGVKRFERQIDTRELFDAINRNAHISLLIRSTFIIDQKWYDIVWHVFLRNYLINGLTSHRRSSRVITNLWIVEKSCCER